MTGNGGSRKRDYTIIVILVIGFVATWWVYNEISPDVSSTINQIAANVSNNTIQISTTQEKLNNTSEQVNVTSQTVNQSILNQKVLAKGINQLGNILINEVSDIKNNTNLIDDIKFTVDEISNKTKIENITLSN